jgi:hypothetical protein
MAVNAKRHYDMREEEEKVRP